MDSNSDIQALLNAATLDPRNAALLSNLGVRLQKEGHAVQALVCLQAAVSMKPSYVPGLINLANVFISMNRHGEAFVFLKAAASAKLASAELLNSLGVVWVKSGRKQQAAACFRQALRLRPAYKNAAVNLAKCLTEAHEHEEAVEAFRLAAYLDPTDARIHVALGFALLERGLTGEATVSFKRSRDLQPDLAQAHAGIAVTFMEAGMFAQAQDSFRQAIGLSPDTGSFYRGLVQCGKLSAGDPLIRRLERKVSLGSRASSAERVEFHFALGKSLDDRGRHDEAFDHYSMGASLHRKTISCDEEVELRSIRNQTAYSAEILKHTQSFGDNSEHPIFIVGMPRSGSTLVEQIVSSHPQVWAVGEVEEFRLCALKAGLIGSAHEDPAGAFTEAAIRETAARYADRVGFARFQSVQGAHITSFTDKKLDNFKLVGLISSVFPRSRIIHTQRSAVDCCLSSFSLLLKSADFTYDLGELGRRYRAYDDLMGHWEASLPSGRILHVQYEDVVADLEGQSRRILAHCGIGWDPACLEFHRNDRSVRTASVFQVRQPIYTTSRRRWRPRTELLRPLLDGLGRIADTANSLGFL